MDVKIRTISNSTMGMKVRNVRVSDTRVSAVQRDPPLEVGIRPPVHVAAIEHEVMRDRVHRRLVVAAAAQPDQIENLGVRRSA